MKEKVEDLKGLSGALKGKVIEGLDDSIVLSVIEKYTDRAIFGKEKYGHTMDRDDLSVSDWLTHLQEELMDATLYVEKLKQNV